MGRKPVPTATLAARGSWRANIRPNEPKPATLSDDKPPSGLKGDARKVWKALAPRLIASGVLSVADVPAFVRYCRIYAAWQTAMADVEAKADRATVLTLAKLDEMLRKLESNFGLTPADRTGIRIEHPEADNKSRFFETRRAS